MALRIIWLLALVLLGGGRADAQGFLRAEGQRIVDGSGNEVILRGMGLGGWMLQEGYMLRTSGPQHVLEARVRDLVGDERQRAFQEAWLTNHTRKPDIDSLAAWGYNSVRLPMHYALFTPPIEEEPVPGEITWREEGFAMVDSLLEWVGANDMYLVLDLHAAPGGQGKNADISDYDPAKPSLWESEANRRKTVELWRRLAERYADDPRIGGYDMINEPNWGFADLEGDPNGCSEEGNAPLWALQREITAAIREVDRNHLVVIEGNCWGNNYRGLPELWDDNLVISFHKYWNHNDLESIQRVLDMREERDAPVWLGESGENSNHWFADAIRLVESQGIGWAFWPLKKLGWNNPLQVRLAPGYEAILDYWNEDGPKPDPDSAFGALMRLAENLKIEHNVHHRDVVDAMIRQPHTSAVVPFAPHVIRPAGTSRIEAVDYDLGRQGHAYHDLDSGNYHVSTGERTPWNRGRVHRNDGVDIAPCDGCPAGYAVAWMQPGEWMQYTVDVERSGPYAVRLVAASATDGRVTVLVNDRPIGEGLALPASGGEQDWRTADAGVAVLQRGTNRLILRADEGDISLQAIELVPRSEAR
jgi:endoglucanase